MSNYQQKPEKFEVSNENQLYFTSDLHYFHKRIVEFTERATTFENLSEWITTQCNSVIPKATKNKKVTTIHLGDFAFSCTNQELEKVILSLNGDWWFVLGNHDNADKLLSAINKINAEKGTNHRVLGWYYRLLVSQKRETNNEKKSKKLLVLCHFPIEDWDSKHYGSAMIHGHCVDMETEILTKSGWKFRNNLNENDLVLTYDPISKLSEYSIIDSIIDLSYTGKAYHFLSKNVSQRVTDLHTMVGLSSKGNYLKKSAEETAKLSEFRFITASTTSVSTSVNLTDDLLKLYIAIAADGSIENTDLVRFRLKKQSKIEFVENLLNTLSIPFKKFYRKDSVVTLNFTLPTKLKEWNIKGLDNKLLNCSKKQFDIIVDTYLKTDGTDYKTYKAIYTSKKSEYDLLSHLSVIHGYTCTTSIRTPSNVNTSESYTLYLKPSQSSSMTRLLKNLSVEDVVDEHFWCIKTKNQNFFIRRNGKISITGNCHGGGSNHEGDGVTKLPNRFDVGIDNSHDQTPFSYEDLKVILRKTRGEIEYAGSSV